MAWIESFTAALDRRRSWILGPLLAGLAFLMTIAARKRDFWNDELFTVLLASLPVAEMWPALAQGFEPHPPLAAVATRAVAMLAGVGPVASRVPAMAGFLVAAVVVFHLVRRRGGVLSAFASVFALVGTIAWHYAVEARGYGLTLALFALLLAAWTEAAAGRRRAWPLVAATLALGVWTHYFFVLASLPVLVGEAVRQRRQRRIDPLAWAALAAAAFACLPLIPLIAAASNYRSQFWSPPSLNSLPGIYRALPVTLGVQRVVLAVLALLVIVGSLQRLRGRAAPLRLPAHEAAAGLALLALPGAAALLGLALHAFDPRYATFTCVGLAIAIPLALSEMAVVRRPAELLLLAALLVRAAQVATNTWTVAPLWKNLYASRPVLVEALASGETVVVAAGVDWLPLWYYAAPGAKDRVAYVADARAEVARTGTDSIDKAYLALGRAFAVPVYEAGDFVARHRRFLLYAGGARWTEDAVLARGATAREIARDPKRGDVLYGMEMP